MIQGLFIHSLFRSGSTYVWNSFRRSPKGYWCYQEPLHEIVLALEKAPNELLTFATNEETKYLRHPKLDKPYYFELVEVHESWQGLVCPEIIYDNYFKREVDDLLINYLSALCGAAKGLPVIQECRTASRIASIKRELGGFHIYLCRNPWDQWWSYKANAYFEAINQVLLNCKDCPQVILKLRQAIGFIAVEDLSLPDAIVHFSDRPLSSANAYSVFYAIWCLALLEGTASADLIVNVDSLSDSQQYRDNIVSQLRTAGFEEITFDDCKATQAVFIDDDLAFFRRAEDKVHGLFLASGYPQSAMDSIKSYRRKYQPKRWSSKSKQVPIQSILEQTSRLRQLVIRVETEGSSRVREFITSSEQERAANVENQKGYKWELDKLESDLLRAQQERAEEVSQKVRESAAALSALKEESSIHEREWLDEKLILQQKAFELERQAVQKSFDQERGFADAIAGLKDEISSRERDWNAQMQSLQQKQLVSERELLEKAAGQERALVAALSSAREESALLKDRLSSELLSSQARLQEIDRDWILKTAAKEATFAESLEGLRKEGANRERLLIEEMRALKARSLELSNEQSRLELERKREVAEVLLRQTQEAARRERQLIDETQSLKAKSLELSNEHSRLEAKQNREFADALLRQTEERANRERELLERISALQTAFAESEGKMLRKLFEQEQVAGALLAQIAGREDEERRLREELLNLESTMRESEATWSAKMQEQDRTFAESLSALNGHNESRTQQLLAEVLASNAALEAIKSDHFSKAAEQQFIYEQKLCDLEGRIAERELQFEREREADGAAAQTKLEAKSTELRILEETIAHTQRDAEAAHQILVNKYRDLSAAFQSAQRAQNALFASRGWRYSAILRNCVAWVFREATSLSRNNSISNGDPGDSSSSRSPSIEVHHVGSTDMSMTLEEGEIRATMELEGVQFIRKSYMTALRREVDPEGLTFYAAQLEQGTPKQKILGQILRSNEARVTGPHSARLRRSLKAYLRSEIGRQYDMEKFESVGRRAVPLESLTRHDGRRFVKQAYLDVLGRLPDPEGFEFYLRRLRAGIPKSAIVSEISSSSEGKAAGAKILGLRRALIAYRLTGLPIFGALFRLFISSEKAGIGENRLRALEQKVVGLSDRLSARRRVSHESSLSAKYAANVAENVQGAFSDPDLHSQAHAHSNSNLTVFTICSKNFTAYAKTLFDSVKAHHPTAELFLFLGDDVDHGYQPDLLPFRTVLLSELDIPNLQEMSVRYNITEFNTAIKPFAFAFLFKKLAKDRVVYIDPDILLTSPMEELVLELDSGAECVLTPHVLEPAENVEVSDVKMLMFGIYNLGFIALRNTPNVVRVVEWWGRRLERDCVIDLPNGLFVDQKWADLLPAYIANTTIIRHPGYNVAYWNLSQRRIVFDGAAWYANGLPLRFVHFSGNKLDDPKVFSRHSWSITLETIGDLKQLLDQYRVAVFANGHADYSRLPYSFSWNGASGVNLHTQKPDDPKVENVQCQEAPLEPVMALDPIPPVGGGEPAWSSEVLWQSRLLFIDCVTPRPDRDAGSITAYYLLKIYVDLGYEVTFIPSDLERLDGYTAALESLGVRCLHREDIGSVHEHLRIAGGEYDYVFVCRAPIAGLYIDDIRQFAPRAKIILNTSDLHYLRDLREAEISGDEEKLNAALNSKIWELDILRRCDVTIVMSTAELEILREELPSSDVRLIPLMYVEPVADCPQFESRSDILFIGGFPHAPNVDAVLFFCAEIFPLIREALPDLRFHVVGNAPPTQILELNEQPGVLVHGFVADISPLFRNCRLSVAPLRYGAGIKGKIGTSLAFGVPAVATSVAVEGMQLKDGEHVVVADTPQQFAAKLVDVYTSQGRWAGLSRRGRELMLKKYSPAVGQQRIARLMKSLHADNKHLALHTLRSMADYESLCTAIREELDERRAWERSLICYDRPNFFLQGFCAACGIKSSFNTSFMYAYETVEDGKLIPNWREHLDCTTCGFPNRIRAAIHVFYCYVKPKATDHIYLTEQSTALFLWLQQRQPNLVGSEYFGSIASLGSQVRGLRNEDLTQLTFSAETFDHVLSFDVLEHVNDDVAALKEIYRCLKVGGTVLFGAPFAKERAHKLIRARTDSDGNVQHLMAPEYHGNPVDPEGGALCYRYFAWDILDELRAIGFKDPRVLHYWSEEFAYLGVEQFLFIATK